MVVDALPGGWRESGRQTTTGTTRPSPTALGCSANRLTATPRSWLTNGPWALLTVSPGRPPGDARSPATCQHASAPPRRASGGSFWRPGVCSLGQAVPVGSTLQHPTASPVPSLPYLLGSSGSVGSSSRITVEMSWALALPGPGLGGDGHVASARRAQGASPPGVPERGERWLSESSCLRSVCWQVGGYLRELLCLFPSGKPSCRRHLALS